MKTANNNLSARSFTRARAHARTPLHAIAGAMLTLVLMLCAGTVWGQSTKLVTNSESSYNTKTKLGGSDGKTHVKITKMLRYPLAISNHYPVF